VIAIDELSFSSKLALVHPKEKLVFSMLPLVLCIGLDSILVSVVTIVVMAAATIRQNHALKKRYLHFMLIPAGFLLLGTLTVLVNQHPVTDKLLLGITIGSHAYGIDGQSLYRGGKLILRAMGAVSCMYFLSFNTPMTSLFQVLRHTKLPSVLVSLMELIYRYIFVIWEEADRMRIAQHSRLGNCDFKTSLVSTGMLASTLFIRAYQRCDRVYAALESRGYENDLDSLTDDYTPCGRFYGYTAVLCVILLALGIAEKLWL
jgi:cobalt/nickel transport system permease protein